MTGQGRPPRCCGVGRLLGRGEAGGDNEAAAIDALTDCEEAVTACASGMLTHDPGAMQMAVGRDLDCADVVQATARVLLRANGPDTSLLSAQLEACLVACEHSNELCRSFAARHEHCRICSEATRRCAEACRQALTALHS
jgi:hypothetical protein